MRGRDSNLHPVIPEKALNLVTEVERSQEFGELTATRFGDVIDVRAQPLRVAICLVELSGAGLGGREAPP